MPQKLSVAQKSEPKLQKILYKIENDISLIFIRSFSSQTNPVFKFNPVFIDILDNFCHNQILCPSIQGFQPQNVLIMFLFSMKQSYLPRARSYLASTNMM